MKASDLRPCDVCGRPLTTTPMCGPSLQFYRVTVDPVFLNPHAIQRHVGLATFFGGGLAGDTLAQAFTDAPDVAVPLSERGAPPTVILACLDCYTGPLLPLCGAAERRERVPEVPG